MSAKATDNNEIWIHSLSVSPEEIAWEAFKAGFGWGLLIQRTPDENDIAYFYDVWRKQTRNTMDDSEVRRAGVPKSL